MVKGVWEQTAGSVDLGNDLDYKGTGRKSQRFCNTEEKLGQAHCLSHDLPAFLLLDVFALHDRSSSAFLLTLFFRVEKAAEKSHCKSFLDVLQGFMLPVPIDFQFNFHLDEIQ